MALLPSARSTAAVLGAVLFSGLVSAQAGAEPPRLSVLDDLGRPIEETLAICYQVELRTDCGQVAPGAQVNPPAAFHGLRIEGEDHGPVSLRREALEIRADGAFQVKIPRKAWLRIEGSGPQEPLAVSLYSPRDNPTFRAPSFRVEWKPGEGEVKVPAGDFVASLSLAPNAPDLHRLTVAPASRVRLVYRPRPGWSLVVRVQSAVSLQPVSRAQVELRETVGYGEPDRPVSSSGSGPDGLVLLSGLPPIMASLAVRHPDHVQAEVHGLTATPGTFAFRAVDLGIGGRIVARVNVHGQPMAGARCQVLALTSGPQAREALRNLWEGVTDAQGLCRSERLAQGIYKLRVRTRHGDGQVNRWVTVPEAHDAEEDVALAPTRVYGEIRRGGKPVPGYRVEAMLLDPDRPPGISRGDISAEAVSDDEGRYEMTLWAPGRFGLLLRSSAGVPTASRRALTTDGDEERQVDFDLEATAFRGVVVDEEERPVEAARVALRWQGLMVAQTDAEGRFEVPVEGEGTGTLHAMKPGYRESEAVDVQVRKDVPIPPVTLVLKRKGTVRGTVLSAAGAPVPNAWIGSGGATPERGPFLFSSTRSGADGGFEVEVPPGPPHLFVSGPGCPLSWFDLPNPGESADGAPAALHCPALPAALEVTLLSSAGKPIPFSGVILRRKGAIVPASVLLTHLQLLGLPGQTDGAGHLVLAGLDPGDYELFLSTRSSESTIAVGRREGYLTAVSLPALQTTELELTLPSVP